MVASLACRSGVRTFVAAWGCRTSLACLLGTLAAVPGSVAMLTHRLTALRAFAVLFNHRFHDLDNLRLLSAWQSGHRIKSLPCLACRFCGA